ncbi:5-dehydro-2-deoxygluconokinase [Sphingobium sp. JS3065]|uniref:bifunctional 5-dehydro-2-deoxygluconokinase/5-dehydro-2- deoxyphosphogluconate aldolase n=1 Tax=Sphingobium sp. JS3065 TaxID=2970925 RepID=UPI0022653B53|nr:5-dehydro-2-deoxygluconokinase [Sphingobium sp. JS3065]UZW54349.1 5-dehydro-2-deoxygluconokinase [Sphingobium sp. JS3065]
MTSKHGQEHVLDLITLGRSSVDLYGEQVGGRLERMRSFAKYIGGSPTNTAVGVARLGLKSGLITRVGSDHMGRFIREELLREGVDVSGVISDPERLTALVLLGIRDADSFPLIFYRENCADMALCEADIDPGLVASAGALLINGTHLSRPDVYAASLKAARAMKAAGGRVIFDIDFRPVLWGLASKENGEDRFVASAAVTAELQSVLPLCDLIVGTEEEIHILGGTTDTVAALRTIRAASNALLVCKRGADGCVAFPGAVPDSLNEGVVGQGFKIEVFNVLGAGDAFMAGFLRGWLRDEPIELCCTYANACGAMVVSRHGCAPAQPSWDELQCFLSRSDWPRRLRDSTTLEHIHWATNRHPNYDEMTVLAIDHRSQFDDLVSTLGTANLDRVPRFKELALKALERVASDNPGFGLLADGRYGMRALEGAVDTRYWIGRPIEQPGSRPLTFEGGFEAATILADWPLDHVVKCLVFYHPDDPADLRAQQDRQILRLFEACRHTRHELLLEIIASKHGPIATDTVARVVEHIYDLGVYPDWWKLEPAAEPGAWAAIERVIEARDPHCRGIVLLGLAASETELLESFAAAAASALVKGFAVGRTIWSEPAARWLKGEIDDEAAVGEMAGNFAVLVCGWRAARREQAA